jgi:hypothetical protein
VDALIFDLIFDFRWLRRFLDCVDDETHFDDGHHLVMAASSKTSL